MTLSVIIPVYNEEKYIDNCLKSLFNQTEKPDEIIVIDNNCNDKTIEIVQKYKNINIIQEKKQGIIPARNKGFNIAKGDILVKIDADSILPKNFIKKIKKNFIKKKDILGIATYIKFYDLPLLKETVLYYDLYLSFSKIILGHYIFAGPAYALLKKGWKKIKNEICLNDKKVHEDIDLAIHLAKYGKIYFDKSIIVLSSGRRIKNRPFSFFVEYPWRFIKMLKTHFSQLS